MQILTNCAEPYPSTTGGDFKSKRQLAGIFVICGETQQSNK